MTVVSNVALNNILDEEADAAAVETQPEEGPSEAELYDERAKRVQAEADADASARKLAVAQTQFAEHLLEKADEDDKLREQAQRLEELLLRVAGEGGNGSATLEAIVAEAGRLRTQLSSAAAAARSTADQVKAEAERLPKRSSQQADLGPAEAGSDVEMKRSRDGSRQGSPAPDDINDEGSDGDAMDTATPSTSNGAAAAAQPDGKHSHDTFRARAKYIPLRLAPEERRMLRLLEGALSVNEYTDKVDILSYKSKTARIHAQIKDLCAILCGLTVAQNYKRGQKLIAERDFNQLASFFQDCFEVGRRHKVMNPEKMRDTYGKLVYMLMDSVDPEVEELVGFRCVRPLRTVLSLLEESGAAAMLDDPLMPTATAEVAPAGLSRHEIQRRIKAKERAREALARKYRSKALPEEDLLRCLYSVSDNNSYLAFARDPVDRMIAYLKANFRPDSAEPGCSLAIQGGAGGARLTHSHERQYSYVLQSLTLWREIAHEMFKLWYLAECDMLDPGNRYRLTNTGQGLQRVQGAGRVGRAMANILARCQRRIGRWVGSSVIHLGDHNVPNALVFIDKYTQVPRILNPLVLVLEELPRLARDPQVAAFIESAHGGVEPCRKAILLDFFRHAFDGSGADNFFDAGSCIDGRLTSAWNWCSKLEKKPYYAVFKLAGFAGFDGDFKG